MTYRDYEPQVAAKTYDVGWRASIDGVQYGGTVQIVNADPYEVGDLLGAQIGESLCEILKVPNLIERIKLYARSKGFDV